MQGPLGVQRPRGGTWGLNGDDGRKGSNGGENSRRDRSNGDENDRSNGDNFYGC